MKKIILLFCFVFLFGFGNNVLVFAEEVVDVTPPVVTSYTLNGIEDSVVFNPNDLASVEIVINTDEPVKFNRIKIINDDNTEVKFFTAYDNFATSSIKTWDGKSNGVVVPDGIYSLQVNIKDVAENTNNNLNLTPFTITVDTSEIPVDDTILPIIESHEDVTIKATSSEGAIVDYTVPNVTDNVDATEPAVCKPASGSLFAIGSTEITCNKTDSAGNIAIPVTFNVIVQDTTSPDVEAPVIDSALDITRQATGPSGAIVIYDENVLTATDNIDGVISVDVESCIPVSGSTFVIGTTPVICSATDSSGNEGNGVAFSVIIEDTNESDNNSNPDLYFSTEGNVVLENGCTIKDTSGVTHNFPNENSPSDFLGICALVSAKNNGLIENFEFIDFGWGLFLESINGVATGPNWDPSWSIYYNGESSLVGLADIALKDEDTVSFIFTSFNDNREYEKVVLHISIDDDQVVSSQTGNGGSSEHSNKDFSVEDAVAFLSLQQDKDESLGGDLYIDWVSVALGGIESSPLRLKLIEYLKSNQVDSPFITENERRAMALMALGINPYNGTEINYIKKITDSFNGIQIKDDSLSDFNDDIFGLIILQNVGYGENDEMINKIILYILSKQSDDGSWGSVDMTGAGIMALNEFGNIEGVANTISKALDYLVKAQDDDGGFGNVYSTSWALQALSLSGLYDKEIEDGIDYLAKNQDDDGGMVGDNTTSRIWGTAYAIPAVLGLSWNDILNEFTDKEEVEKTIVELKTDEVSAEKKVYTYLDFIDQVQAEDISKEVKDENIQNEDLIEGLDLIEESDLMASAGLSTDKDFFSGKNIILAISLIINIFLGSFVIRKILIQ